MITIFQNDKGRSPPWLAAYSSAVFKAVWKSYDLFFKPLFGDGERTVEDNNRDEKESMLGDGNIMGNGTITGRLPGGENSVVL